ncbi:MAG: hypothetical protein ACOCQR_02440 [bacterium]
MQRKTYYSCSCLKMFVMVPVGDLFGSVEFLEFNGEHRKVKTCPKCNKDLAKELVERNAVLKKVNQLKKEKKKGRV